MPTADDFDPLQDLKFARETAASGGLGRTIIGPAYPSWDREPDAPAVVYSDPTPTYSEEPTPEMIAVLRQVARFAPLTAERIGGLIYTFCGDRPIPTAMLAGLLTRGLVEAKKMVSATKSEYRLTAAGCKAIR